MGFASLGLSTAVVQGVETLGYEKPTAIQIQTIPPILKGRDVMAAAQTGTGKTAAFLLPLLQRLTVNGPVRPNQARCLVLAPTRELANQICDSAKSYGQPLNLRIAAVYGGVKINPQMMQMRKGVDLLIATPGRLLDLLNSNAIRFDQLESLVLDEADKMLNLGFTDELEQILALLPPNRQNLLFSATFSPDIRALGKKLCPNLIEITTNTANAAATSVKQILHPVDKKQKIALLRRLLREHDYPQTLVFTKTRKGANQVCNQLNTAKISADTIHGDKSQSQRNAALTAFKQGAVKVLVATDVAARGLDIDSLPLVINFELPVVAEDYVHRIGRTGRSNRDGQALSLVCADEFDYLNAIEQFLRRTLPREEVDGFEPKHNLPVSRAIVGPKNPKKPKKPKSLILKAGDSRGSVGSKGRNENSKNGDMRSGYKMKSATKKGKHRHRTGSANSN